MTTYAEMMERASTPRTHRGMGNTNARRKGPSKTDITPRLFKTCIGCHVTLPRDRFYAHPTGIYGLAPRCKDCVREQDRERREWFRMREERWHTDRWWYG